MILRSCKAVSRRVREFHGRAGDILLVVVLLFPGSLSAADASGLPAATKEAATKEIVRSARVVGRAAVVDGRTLWLPGPRMLVRLSDIDTCDLPQWSFDPHAATAGPSPAPVACGALAMAWLKRLVGDRRVTCLLDPGATGTVHVGVCRVGSLDLGREMLRVGWARLATGGASRPTIAPRNPRPSAGAMGSGGPMSSIWTNGERKRSIARLAAGPSPTGIFSPRASGKSPRPSGTPIASRDGAIARS